MAKQILVVISSPVGGREDEYNRWYTGRHLPDILGVPGFKSAQRFKMAASAPSGVPGSYLAIYEYERATADEDPDFPFSLLQRATKSGQMFISQSMDATKIFASMFTPITEKLKAAELK